MGSLASVISILLPSRLFSLSFATIVFYCDLSSYSFRWTSPVGSFLSFVCTNECFSLTSASFHLLFLRPDFPLTISSLPFPPFFLLTLTEVPCQLLCFSILEFLCVFFKERNVSLLILYLRKYCPHIIFICTWSTVVLWIYL